VLGYVEADVLLVLSALHPHRRVAGVACAFVATCPLARAVRATMGLRVTENEEYVGLDISQHGEKAYA